MKKAKGYTKVDNVILYDETLSLEARGLYAIIKSLITIPNFKLMREHVKKLSGYGETAFRRVWGELKEKGLLTYTKEKINGKYEYEYELAGVKEKEKKKKATTPSETTGQTTEFTEEQIEEVHKLTNLTATECQELLKASNGDIKRIEECYKYTASRNSVKHVFNYLKWAIKNLDLNVVTRSIEKIKSTFNNFSQRTYDFGKLERALQYGEAYELPH